MQTDNIKKIIATAIATGTLVTGASIGINRANCDYVVQNGGEEICITEELKVLIEESQGISQGFGGIKFGG